MLLIAGGEEMVNETLPPLFRLLIISTEASVTSKFLPGLGILLTF